MWKELVWACWIEWTNSKCIMLQTSSIVVEVKEKVKNKIIKLDIGCAEKKAKYIKTFEEL